MRNFGKKADEVLQEVENLPCVYGPKPFFDPRENATLSGVKGEHSGQVFPLHHSPFRIGRDLSCDIRLSDAKVSRDHIRLLRMSDGWLMCCMGLNGVLLDGQRIAQDSPPQMLHEGSTLDILGHVFCFSAGCFSSAPPARVLAEVEEMITVYGPPPVFGEPAETKRKGLFQRRTNKKR